MITISWVAIGVGTVVAVIAGVMLSRDKRLNDSNDARPGS